MILGVGESRGLLVVGAILLVTAVAADFAWFRPAQARVEDLLARRAEAERTAAEQLTRTSSSRAFLDYARGFEEPDVDWVQHFRDRDALEVLESLRRIAGLQRRDLTLIGREEEGEFVRTSYYMLLTGSYERHQTFLRSLEQAMPLVTIDSFVLDAGDRGGSHTLKVNASVHTLRGPRP